MKCIQAKSAFLAVSLVCGLLSCKEETLLPDLEGSLVGYVFTNDEFSQRLEDHSGVMITAIGAAYIDQSHSDASGRFEFRRLPAGTYELHLEKPGFGTIKQSGIQHLGGKPTILGLTFNGSTWGAFEIYRQPTTQIVNLNIENDTLTGEFSFTGERPYSLTLMLYLSAERNFISTEATWIVIRYLSRNNDVFNCPVYATEFPFQPGAAVYYRGAVVNGKEILYNSNTIGIIDPDIYVNYYTGRIIYPNLGNESGEFSFIFQE